MSMKLYLVDIQGYEEEQILGVFSSYEKAEHHLMAQWKPPYGSKAVDVDDDGCWSFCAKSRDELHYEWDDNQTIWLWANITMFVVDSEDGG